MRADNLFQCMTVDAGVLQNYIDVGAEDCGALIALGNTFANLAGPVTTALGVYLRARTGCASNSTLATQRLFRDWRCLRVGAGQGLECAALRDGELAIPRRDRQLAVLRRHAPRPLTNACAGGRFCTALLVPFSESVPPDGV